MCNVAEKIAALWQDRDHVFRSEKLKKVALYQQTIERLYKVNVAEDADFQAAYNQFYRTNRRTADWKRTYFGIMEREKGSADIRFPAILSEMKVKTGRVEASFVSKLIATIDPDQPVYDSIVRKRLCLPYLAPSDEMSAIRNYALLKEWHANAAQSPTCADLIAEFDARLPAFREFTPTKKLDLMLWCWQPLPPNT